MGELVMIGIDGGTIYRGHCGSKVFEEIRRQWMQVRLREVNGLVDGSSFLVTADNSTIYLPDISAVSYVTR